MPTQARLDRPGSFRAFMGLPDGCKINCANQNTRRISRHDLRMHLRANPTNPFVANPPVFNAALLSNMVYPPLVSSRALVGIAARRINADRYA